MSINMRVSDREETYLMAGLAVDSQILSVETLLVMAKCALTQSD